jgi:hypothetical protein
MTIILLPALIAAVIVWLGASVMHMAMPHHKKDFKKLPNEKAVWDGLHDAGILPGQYNFPMPEKEYDWRSPELADKAKRGPVGLMVVGPNGMPNMGRQLGLHFVHVLVICLFAGYVAYAALDPGASYLTVFRVVGTAAWLGFSGAHFTYHIWYWFDAGFAWRYAFDGLVYALITAGVFGWLLF